MSLGDPASHRAYLYHPPQASSRGLAAWSAALSRGLLPDDGTLLQLVAEGDDFAAACAHAPLELMAWPEEPLRTMMLRAMAKLGVGRWGRGQRAKTRGRAARCWHVCMPTPSLGTQNPEANTWQRKPHRLL